MAIKIRLLMVKFTGFPGGSVVKNSTEMQGMHAGDMGLIPGSGRSSGKGNGNPLHYSCLGNPRDRGACWATVQGSQNSWEWLSD